MRVPVTLYRVGVRKLGGALELMAIEATEAGNRYQFGRACLTTEHMTGISKDQAEAAGFFLTPEAALIFQVRQAEQWRRDAVEELLKAKGALRKARLLAKAAGVDVPANP